MGVPGSRFRPISLPCLALLIGLPVARGADDDLAALRAGLSSESPAVRATAAISVRDERLVPDVGALLADGVPGVRAAAALALARFPSALPLLLAATGDADPEVVETALQAIEGLGDPRALARIERLFASPQPRVRAAAAHALVLLGGASTHGAPLEEALRDRDPSVRLAAVRGVRERPAPEAVPFLEPLSVTGEPRVRHEVALALGAIASSDSLVVLRAMLRDTEPEIRAVAVSGLGRAQSPGVVGVLAPLARDPSESVRMALAEALGRLRRPEGLVTLSLLARDVYSPVRRLVAFATAAIGTEAALPVLDTLLRDGELDVRIEAIHAIGSLPQTAAAARLRDQAARAKGPVRIAAIEQLGERRDRQSTALLRRCLDDPDESLRAAARLALEAIDAGP